jgi:hypothetical protein
LPEHEHDLSGAHAEDFCFDERKLPEYVPDPRRIELTTLFGMNNNVQWCRDAHVAYYQALYATKTNADVRAKPSSTML